MPLYEYKCKSCGALFEVRQKFVDEQTVLNRKLREHRMGSLAPSRRVASEVGQRLAAVDAEIAAVEAEALKPWPA
jgi:predicted nucleic acid-binding Zn ribbon protein